MNLNIGKKAERAQQLIVRYIWDNALKAGDKLPSCNALAQKLGLGSTTVFRAMKEMQLQGVLESRDKVGIFVKDPQTPGRTGYTIGILVNFEPTTVYTSTMACCILNYLLQNGVRGVLYPCSVPPGTSTASLDVLSSCFGLREGIERGEVHGLITMLSMCEKNWNYLDKWCIPCCFLGGFVYLDAPMCVCIDAESFILSSFARVKQLGLKHPALLLPLVDTQDQIFELVKKLGAEFPSFHIGKDCWRYITVRNYETVCQEILKRKLQDRPDALICPDDVIAQRIYGYMVRNNGNTGLPRPIVLGIARALRENFPVAADFMEYSYEKLAGAASKTVLDVLRTGKISRPFQNQKPKLFIQNVKS